jgi:MFS family permease
MYLITALNVIIHGCQVGSRVVMALFAIRLGASPFEIGVMVALYSLPPLCFGVYTGRITDRYGVHRPMLLGAVLCGGGLLMPYFWPTVPSLYASAATIGFSFMFYTVAVQSLTGAWGPREQRAKNFSTLALGYSISGLLGPVCAGYAIDFGGHRLAYLGFAVSTLIPLVMLLTYRPLREIKLPQAAPSSGNAMELLRQPELRKVLINSALVVSGWDLYMFYLPIYGDSIGLSASRIGTILGVFAAATFIMRFSLPYLTARYTARNVLAVSMFSGAALFVAFPFVSDIWLLSALSFGIGLALGCGQPITLLMSYNRSPEGRAGEVTGIRFALNHLMHSVVPVSAGALASVFGLAPVFIINAGILAYAGQLTRSIRATPAAAPASTP